MQENALKIEGELAVVYCRISSELQERGNSKDDQERDAIEYAERMGLAIVKVFSAVESAWKEGRENFNEMIAFAKDKNIRNIIFKNADRLGRNDIDWPRCKKLARIEGFKIHLYELNIVFNSESTAEEEMFLDNTSVMAKYWSNKLSQGIRRGLGNKAKRGNALRLPLGYVYDRDLKKWLIDEDWKDTVNLIFDLCDKNEYSGISIAGILQAKGIKNKKGHYFSEQSIYCILKNKSYAGYFLHRGEWVKGDHSRYISEHQYNQRIKKMSERRKHRIDQERRLFSKFLVCSICGKTFTGSRATIKGREYTRYLHLCVDNKQNQITEKKIFELIHGEINKIFYDKQYTDFLKELFTKSVKSLGNKNSRERKEIDRQLREYELKKSRLLDLFSESGIKREDLISKIKEYDKSIESLHEYEKSLTTDLQEHEHNVIELLDYLTNFRFDFLKASPGRKSEVIREMADCIYVNQKTLEIEIAWKEPFSFLLKKQTLSLMPATIDKIAESWIANQPLEKYSFYNNSYRYYYSH